MQRLTSFDSNTLQTALEALIPTGIFDTVQNSSGNLTCKKNDQSIIYFGKSGNNWYIKPYINSQTQATGSHIIDNQLLMYGFLCAQGLYLITGSVSNVTRHIIITKGSTGNAVTMIGQESSAINLSDAATYYITSYNDDTSTILYTSGYNIPGLVITQAIDRTQLLKLPICGQQGSTGYITGCQAILLRQFVEAGVVEINGIKYYCHNRFAIIDE